MDSKPADLKPYHCGYHGHRTKSCSPRRNGCGFRYPKGSGLLECPQCGMDRWCRNRIVHGYKTCRMHGAGSPNKGRPGGAPKIQGGRYSKVFRDTGYWEIFQDSLNDPKQLELRELIAIADARLVELGRRTQGSDSSKIWRLLEKQQREMVGHWQGAKNALAGFIRATNAQDRELARKYLDDLASILQVDGPLEAVSQTIEDGKVDWAIWEDIFTAAEHRRRLTETERRLYVDTQRMVALDKMIAHLDAFMADVRELVQDPAIQNILGYRLMKRLSNQHKNLIEGEVVEVS